MIGTMLQAAGPRLTPQTMAAGVQKNPVIPGNISTPSRGLNGDWSWYNDMRLVYWDSTKPSPVNDKPGTYVDVTPGKRYLPGQYPQTTFVRPKA